MEVGKLSFTWKIKNFSKLETRILYSEVFFLGPYKWRIRAYPKGEYVQNYLSVYLEVADSKTLPSKWSRSAKYSLTVVNQFDNTSSITRGSTFIRIFYKENYNRGFPSFISHKKLHDPRFGYLVRDTCIIEANLTIYGDAYIEREPTKEDMDAFFVDLNSEIFPTKAEEEAKQALAKLEEASNMVPADLNNQASLSQLRSAFDVLSSLDECSTITLKQKAEFLLVKDSFTALPSRTAKAVEDINRFNESEVIKTNLDRTLGRCLIEFEKAKAEKIQNEKNMAAVQAQIEEMKRKNENALSKLKEMFKLSKELKAEPDVIVKNWSKYEAKMKAAKEEGKVVSTKWSKMKQLVSSLKNLFQTHV